MVDFIDLANSHRWLLQRVLDGGGAADDDFAKIETGSDTSSSGQSNNAAQQTYYYNYDTVTINGTTSPAPLLSKSAEAELYLLATNFLLCTSSMTECVFK